MPPRRVGRRNGGVPQNGPAANENEVNVPPPARDILDIFMKRSPPMFDGKGDPATAETWLRAIERIFNLLRCTDRERMTCVAFQLVESADYWWEARTKTMIPEQVEQMTWEAFRENFSEKYIPRNYRRAKEEEFFNLKQGRMSVNDYDRMFCDMSRYAPDQVDTDAKMSERFRAGLRYEIKMALASHGPLSYLESLGRAQDVEVAMPKEKTISPPTPAPNHPQQNNFRDKRKWNETQASPENKRHQMAPRPPQNGGRQGSYHQGGSSGMKVPFCAKCSRNHFGECKAGSSGCFSCGKVGHFSRECPSRDAGVRTRQNTQGQRPQLQALQAEPMNTQALPPPPPQQRQRRQRHSARARAYALRSQQLEIEHGDQGHDNLAGMGFHRNIPITIIFDTGATHSLS